MSEIRELDIVLSDDGWDKSGGKSYNVWGLVDFPPELLAYLKKYKKTPIYTYDPETGKRKQVKDKKASVWTAYDDVMYAEYQKNGKFPYLPKISATFKSCFDKYGAVAENIGMKMAMLLDMPTSYNYIVKFDKAKHKRIIQNYPNKEKQDSVLPYGIVSIDFLQVRPKKYPKIDSKLIETASGKMVEIDSISEIEGDKLVTFEDALRKYKFSTNNVDGAENLIENWIKVVDEIAKKELDGVPKERLNKVTDHIHSRIARSFLLKDCILGDCDFTAYNGGVVINHETKKFRYAPNHDYGESFNGLLKHNLEFDPFHGMTQTQIDALPQNVKEVFLTTAQRKSKLPISEIAKQPASPVSEQNFEYVISNFPEASKEFFKNLYKLSKTKKIEKMIDEYTFETCNGTPLLSKEDASAFKEYLRARIEYYTQKYLEFLETADELYDENNF